LSQHITIIGSGNVASWFAFKMKKAGYSILQVYSHNLKNAELLAGTCGAEAIDDLDKLRYDSDLFLFSVKDDYYEKLLGQLKQELPLAVHTAGSIGKDIFLGYAKRFGVMYPYQTISKSADFNNLTVPVCIEGNTPETQEILEKYAENISSITYPIDEQQRFQLHLAAVFASNFTNALYGIGYDILVKHHIDRNIILPLLQNTLDKTKTIPPGEAQTGPAFRNDTKTIQKQLAAIENEDLKKIYGILTDWIRKSNPNNSK
jgi:predicted short-subunit dehydrogenase-like oxidoreductase (DUF2520 family)